jgi:hypothetical protein
MYFKQFFDDKLAQYAYLIGCQANGTAVVIDPMRDIDVIDTELNITTGGAPLGLFADRDETGGVPCARRGAPPRKQ